MVGSALGVECHSKKERAYAKAPHRPLETKTMNTEKLKQWFHKRPEWLKKATVFISDKSKLQDEDYKVLYEHCLNEAKNSQNGSSENIPIPIEKLFNDKNTNSIIKLKSISNIKGINALSPKNPLSFGDTNLSIIYGLNGSGKSGYARILKHICGAKSCSTIFQNIYEKLKPEQKCTIEYQKGNETKSIEWSVSNKKISELSSINIFDSACGQSYVVDENEITYEPPILSFFSNLVAICEKVSSKINDAKEKIPCKKPQYPDEYKNTEGAKWYDNLYLNTKETDVSNYCLWTEDNQKELQELQQRLSQKDPVKEAEKIRTQNKHLQELIKDTDELIKSFSNEKCNTINNLKQKLIEEQKVAKVVADDLFKQSSLNGIGSETWKQLWHYAKAYSEQEAYKGQLFPVVSDGALCVLCHQKLDENAKKRFTSFKDFIQGEAQKAVEETQSLLENDKKNLPNILNKKEIDTKIDASGLQSFNNTELKKLFTALETRKNQLLALDIQSNFTPLPSFENWKIAMEQVVANNEHKVKQYDEDAKESNRASLLLKQKELKMRKWLSEQITSIKEEVNRLKCIDYLKSAKELTDTTALSKKKSELSEELITKDFIERFNNELEKLRAKGIKVELSRSRTKKGKALHQIRLKDVNNLPLQKVEISDILSEGEMRIVALSAFLADVTGGKNPNPFVFDDPISSLDQNYEEAVVRRLIDLSKERQVIVFTHRLSMLGLIVEYTKKENINYRAVSVVKEPWGTGEPKSIPFSAKSTKKALSDLINRLSESKRCFEIEGSDTYREKAKALCSDFRDTIENTIEHILLNDVVKRHRRAVHTTKIRSLSKINQQDCKLLDKLMTKYSTYLHSSTQEIPVGLPNYKELKQDFESLKSWITEFQKRRKIDNKDK